jgi:peroxiredoxin
MRRVLIAVALAIVGTGVLTGLEFLLRTSSTIEQPDAPRNQPAGEATTTDRWHMVAVENLLDDDGRVSLETESRNLATAEFLTQESAPSLAVLGTVTLPFSRRLDLDGSIRQPLADPRSRAAVFIFLATHCPISNGSLPELNRLHDAFSDSGIEFYGVIADPQTTRREAAIHRREYGINYPVLFDVDGELQQQLRATHTPQAVVVGREGAIKYSGRIDDRYLQLSRPRLAARRRDLHAALTAILRGEAPELPRTDPVGCRIEPVHSGENQGDITFSRDIAPILFANCTGCHRAGEAAPFPLVDYDDVRRRATQIAHVVETRLMPPWKPAADVGRFQNERRLTEREIELIQRWAMEGAPYGDPADLPTPPRFTTGWQLGLPDLILEMPEEFNIPADGPDIYRHFVLPTGLTNDQFIAAFEFRPGNAAVVHHSFLYLDTSGEARRLDAADPGPGYSRFGGLGFRPVGGLGGWGPGGLPRRLPDGLGRPIPRQSDLVLQVHYHPTGKPERDQSKVGLYFARSVRQLVTEIMVADSNLEIPPGERQFRFEASYTLPVEVDLLDASPHMHLLGRTIEVRATSPDGAVIPLIRIDDWNFFWQDHYVFREPVRLPAGSRIELVATFDNSADNPDNPHSPPRWVRFGEESGDEMAICYFQATTDRPDDLLTLAEDVSRYYDEMMERHKTRQIAGELTDDQRGN